MKKAISLMCLALTIVSAAAAQPAASNVKRELSAAYVKASRAAQLKYLEGIYSIRGPEFEVIQPDGRKADLALERSQQAHLLSSSLKIREKTVVKSVEMRGPNSARCRVEFLTEFTMLDSASAKPYVLKLDTLCEDDWTKGDKGWLQSRSRVLRQGAKRIELAKIS